MAHKEPVTEGTVTHDAAAHVNDYARFTKLVKWGAIAAAIAVVIVLLILK